MGMNLLKVNNLYHTYYQGGETIDVLNNVNLEFKNNQIVGLIGPSGSGKSTLLNLFGLIEKPINGSIKIDEIETTKLDNNAKTLLRKNTIGLIFQNNQLLEEFNCLENICLPLFLNGVNIKESKQIGMNLLKKFNLEERANFKPSLLSGGEQQRVAVLRALIKKPKILLADEPTGSLDKKNAKMVMNFIKKLSIEYKTLTIIATHNLEYISEFDFCLKINNGNVIEIQ